MLLYLDVGAVRCPGDLWLGESPGDAHGAGDTSCDFAEAREWFPIVSFSRQCAGWEAVAARPWVAMSSSRGRRLRQAIHGTTSDHGGFDRLILSQPDYSSLHTPKLTLQTPTLKVEKPAPDPGRKQNTGCSTCAPMRLLPCKIRPARLQSRSRQIAAKAAVRRTSAI